MEDKRTFTGTASFDSGRGNTMRIKFPKVDEFLPIVNIESEKIEDKDYKLSNTKEIVTLSKHLDSEKRSFTLQQLTTTKRQIKVFFKVTKGSNDTWDDDGYIEAIISDENEDIKITNKSKFKIKYGDMFEIDIEIKSKEKKEFYLNFYANDDEDDYNKGEYKNVHCGKIKILFDYCVCTDWKTIPAIIPSNKFIGWGHSGITENCFHYSLEQLRQVGHWVKSERWNKKWDGTKELNDNIFQIFLEADVAGMSSGVQKNEFKKGIEYLKKTIKSKIPVMVGVDDGYELDNDDMTTEHFVVIVGMGTDTIGNYFLFYDNATGDKTIGTSSKNKLYCKCNVFKLEGIGDTANSYIQGSSKRKYTVTQIRETK